MKKLLIVTAVLMLMGSAVGCQCCDWCFRGAACPPVATCPPVTTYSLDASPSCGPCDPCGAAPAIVPGPAPYTAVPGP